MKYVYFAEVGVDFEDEPNEEEILTGIDKLGRQLEMDNLFENILVSVDRRLARQRRTEEVARGRDQVAAWFKDNALQHKVLVDSNKADDVRWDRDNGIFADVLLRADEEENEIEELAENTGRESTLSEDLSKLTVGIPIGPFSKTSRSPSRSRKPRRSVLYPVHRAMLIRSEVFSTMFSSAFREAQHTPYLQIVPVACSPEVLEVILTYLYTENSDFPLDIAIEVLFAADLLFIDKLKVKAVQIISTLGNAKAAVLNSEDAGGDVEEEDVIDIYDVMRAGWDTRMQRLEEFAARFIAYRLERYIDEDEFLELVKESAGRVKERQETDTIELVDEYVYLCTLSSRNR